MIEQPGAPQLVVVAGPNGAGKSTAAPVLLRDALQVSEFVNADTIALGLSAFRPESVAFSAGRVMLQRMNELALVRASFAFETTLASRSFASWIAELKQIGYSMHLLFLSLQSADLAVERVADRVRLGGHHVPQELVRRRYGRGLRNLFTLYLPLAESWQLFDNSLETGPRLIAAGAGLSVSTVRDGSRWGQLTELYCA